MDFNMNIGENMSFEFKTGSSSHTETSLLVGYAEIISDGTVGIAGIAVKVENI